MSGSDERAKAPQRPMTSGRAAEIVAAAEAYAAGQGTTISTAVVDESGNLVAFKRGDDCAFVTFETARGKAVLAAGFRLPTRVMAAQGPDRASFWASVSDKLGLVVAAGGYPITQDGVLIGAVGCGGGHGSLDEACAAAAAAATSQ